MSYSMGLEKIIQLKALIAFLRRFFLIKDYSLNLWNVAKITIYFSLTYLFDSMSLCCD